MPKTLYNYIFFNSADGNARKKTPNAYNTICVSDLEKMANVKVVSFPLDYACTPIRFMFWAHHTPKINKVLNLPLKKIWYPYYFRAHFAEKRPLCFVIVGTYATVSIDYLRYLKRKYPDCKIVRIHRDLIPLWRQKCPEYTDEIIAELFDLQMSYDQKEAEEYGMIYFSEFESAIDLKPSAKEPLCDVFFAGKAKDRLDKLMAVYHKLTAFGITCNYYLTGVPQEQREAFPGIEYADKNLSYREMLQRSVDSRCLLEINQGGAVGYTSRFLEAVIYNKKLLTDNLTIADTKFYNPKYIQCFSNPGDIVTDFVKADIGEIDYHYNGEFSPCRLIEQIDIELSKNKKME